MFIAHFIAHFLAPRIIVVRPDAIDWDHPLTRMLVPAEVATAE